MKLSADKETELLDTEALSALLSIAKEMDGQALDALISALAEVRANTQPPVESTRPVPTEGSTTDTPVTIEDSPAMMAVRLRDGRFRVWARSSGFGWLAFNLDQANARAIRDWFAANVEGDSDLFSHGSRHAH